MLVHDVDAYLSLFVCSINDAQLDTFDEKTGASLMGDFKLKKKKK